MIETALAALGVALAGTGLGIGVGIKLASKNGKVTKADLIPRENIVTKDLCQIKHGELDKKVTFTQFLLMESTTPEQQSAARHKMESFEGAR